MGFCFPLSFPPQITTLPTFICRIQSSIPSSWQAYFRFFDEEFCRKHRLTVLHKHMVSSIYLIFIIKWIILAMKPNQTRGNPVSVRTDQASGPHPVSNIFHTDFFTRIRFHTQTLFHTKTFHARRLLHIDAFTHKNFYRTETGHAKPQLYPSASFCIQRLLHTKAFTNKIFYPKKVFHANTLHKTILHRFFFPYKPFYTQTLFTQTLLHTDPFIHRAFYTQTLL